MEIVEYSDAYRADVYRLVKEFHDESLGQYIIDFDLKMLQAFMNELIGAGLIGSYPCCFLAVVDGKVQGLIAGKQITTPWGATKLWHEFVWYMVKGYRSYGVRLLRHAQSRLKELGFEAIILGHMHNLKAEKLTKFYERLGFRPMETHYIGALT